MNKILALTTMNNTVDLKDAVNDINDSYSGILHLQKVYFDDYEDPRVSLAPLKNAIDCSDIVLVDVRGDVRIARELTYLLSETKATIIVLIGGSQRTFALTRMGKFRGDKIFKPGRESQFDVNSYIKAKKYSEMTKRLGKFLPVGSLKDMRNWVLCQEYYAEGGRNNLRNMLLLLLKEYANQQRIAKVPEPQNQLPYGLYLPGEGVTQDLAVYHKWAPVDPDRPTLGILMYGGMHFPDTRPIADMVYERLRSDFNFIMVFSHVESNVDALEQYFDKVDCVLNLQYFRINGGPYGGNPEPTFALLNRLDVPVVIGLRAFETDDVKWRGEREGITPIELMLGVVTPELDGCIEPLMVAAMSSSDDATIGKVKETVVFDDRMDKLCDRIRNWTYLKRKKVGDKRLAIIIYDYPPGEANLGGAGYLDVFHSLDVFLGKLKERGYVLNLPQAGIKELLQENSVFNSPSYHAPLGMTMPVQEYIERFESLPEAVRKEVVRHWGPPPGNIMVEHGHLLIPAVVLGNVFIGVQPSRGVHEDPDKSYHDKDLPPHHQYLAYYMALEQDFQADAILHFGMHGTLEFTKGKNNALSSECYPDLLIGNMPNVYYYWIGNTSESTIAKRRSYAICISHASPPMRSSGLYDRFLVLEDLLRQYGMSKDGATLDAVRSLAKELHLSPDPGDLEKEITKMRRRLIPYGLHVMDKNMTDEERADFLLGALRIDRDQPSVLKLLSKSKGVEWDALKNTLSAEPLEREAREGIATSIKGGCPPSWMPEGYPAQIRALNGRLDFTTESEALLKVLDGRYILPARGGDPIRDPEVYPPGRGMYAFDPRAIPTIAATARGNCAAERIVATHKQVNGKCPESVGVILWGFETMKTGGDTIASILRLIGVRVKQTSSSWFKELEVIPLQELGRPRIDVVITICGIFRDTFGTHIELLNRAIRTVATLDEPTEMNYVRKHYLAMQPGLGDHAMARIFGPSPTEYATSMRTRLESGNWQSEGELVESYDDSMSYAYINGKIERSERALRGMLGNVEIVAHERDNSEYEITDLDHYYEFTGGLARSVQEKRGTKPTMLIVDTTEEEVAVEDIQACIERATRTRVLNPKWLEGMLNHDFHGAQHVKERVENLIGFAATTGKVQSWVFETVADKLVFNETMRRKLQANNKYATVKIGELLIESERRGYWQTDEKKVKTLRELVLEMEGELE